VKICLNRQKQWKINSVCFIGLNETHSGLFKFKPVLISAIKTSRGQTFVVIKQEDSVMTLQKDKLYA
jgi:hypothetical protein